jgi:transmembrane sensor
LITAARAHRQSDNVVTSVAFGGPQKTSSSLESRPHRWTARPMAIAAAVALLVAGTLAWFVAYRWFDPSDIRTAIGEQRSVTLADGSIVTLNTNSELHVDLEPAVRHIQLVRGEARFKVAEDPSRPFIVRTPQATVRAIGTVFNVYAGDKRTEVAVLEGRIELRDLAEPARSESSTHAVERIELGAGQQAAVIPGGDILRNVGPPIERVAAWTERRLVFREEALADVIAEFNRYHEHPIRIEDAALAAVRISGTFDSSDPNSLIQYLERFENVHVEERQDGSHLLQ